MAQSPGGDEVMRTGYQRAWLQRGGPRPSNPIRYAGADGAYVEVGDAAIPVRGITRDQVADPYQIGAYRTTGIIQTPPEFATNQVMFRNKRGVLPWLEVGAQCEYNLYNTMGFCRNPADFSGGWETGVTIFSKGLATTRNKQGLAKFVDDVVSMTQADTTWTGGIYDIGPLSFGEEATAEVTREIVDVAYATAFECGRCGPGNDGTIWRYALQQDDGASTGIRASVIYTTDDGATYQSSQITTLAGNDTVVAMDIMGGYVVVLSDSGNAYHYAPIDDLLGTVGAWTAVTSGFVALNLPRDLWVASPNLAFIAADNGYIYQLSGVGQAVTVASAAGATTEDLRRINGSGETIVAVGANGAVVVSGTRGRTWGAAAGSLGVADTVQAVEVLDPYLWWVGTDAGQLFYTETGGASWAEYAFSGSGAGQVLDIVAATPEVLYFSHSTAAPDARIFASITGGAVFDLSTLTNQRRLVGLPTFDRANRLAVPTTGQLASRAGHLLVGGLAGNGTDGILLHAATAFDFSS